MEYKDLVKRAKPPTPDYHKVTVRPLKFKRPQPVPKLKKCEVKIRLHNSFDGRD